MRLVPMTLLVELARRIQKLRQHEDRFTRMPFSHRERRAVHGEIIDMRRRLDAEVRKIIAEGEFVSPSMFEEGGAT